MLNLLICSSANTMPKRTDIKSILIIGAGPIIIGQACEFDYSGAQACKALKEEGYRVILVNSNPATIMTDPNMADATYIEPITPEFVEKIIAKEKPDVLLPTMGGQTALNCALELHELGILEKHNVSLIGVQPDSIDKAENRARFNEAMAKIGLNVPANTVVDNIDDALEFIKTAGLPAIIRPSFTLGGTGGGIANTMEEFKAIVASGLDASPTNQVLIDESLLGWKEYEMEVVRDKADNCIIICAIENVDPMGVHTGDSITVAPALTLTDKEYQRMRNASIAVLREIGVETGGSNVQFGVNPENGKMVVIEMNPRVSRSSALASKATGYPIAKVAAKLAIGYTLDEITNDCTGCTPASFEPSIDYVVTKIPRFTFEKFAGAEPILTSAMKSVGEVMAIGSNFAESLQKALRSLETGVSGLNDKAAIATADLDAELAKRTPKRIMYIAEAMRRGYTLKKIQELTEWDQWFLDQIEEIVSYELDIKEQGIPEDKFGMLAVKKKGFSDARLAELAGKTEDEIRALRHSLDVRPVFKRIDSCAGEFAAITPYMYSTYAGDGVNEPDCEAGVSDEEKIIVLGSGPNRIGQGIEFDYACVHALFAAKEDGYESIMVNCNPETVSTDYDTSDRLYFEPITYEDVSEIIYKEQTAGKVKGVNMQFGGQTPLKLANKLHENNFPLLGTSAKVIDDAEDRDLFKKLLEKLDLKQPENAIANTPEEAKVKIEEIGFPVVVRPSFVLGGQAMAIVDNTEGFAKYLIQFPNCFEHGPLLLDRFLNKATEVDVDVISDGDDIFIAGVMEHIEEAGVHSGDSACSIPPYSLSDAKIDELKTQATQMAKELGIIGLMNVQFAVSQEGTIYVLEVNPRASRTVPFVAKATGVPVAKIAAKVMAGKKLKDIKALTQGKAKQLFAVKEVVFPFSRFADVDVVLGPEMKSTGEAMGYDADFEIAFYKGQLGTGNKLPLSGNVFISVRNKDKEDILPIAQKFANMGFNITATEGTAKHLNTNGIKAAQINKVLEGSPHIVDAIKEGKVDLVINTTEGEQALQDSFSIRRNTLIEKIPYTTTATGAREIVASIEKVNSIGWDNLEVISLQA